MWVMLQSPPLLRVSCMVTGVCTPNVWLSSVVSIDLFGVLLAVFLFYFSIGFRKKGACEFWVISFWKTKLLVE